MRLHSTLLTLAAIGLIWPIASPAPAGDAPRHYEAVPSDTLAAAMDNFVTYNRQLRDVLAREPFGVEDMEEVHELTYTLEVALARINAELGALPVLLEDVHLSSEGDDAAALRAAAALYLEQAILLDR